jgi:hypothetical protein
MLVSRNFFLAIAIVRDLTIILRATQSKTSNLNHWVLESPFIKKENSWRKTDTETVMGHATRLKKNDIVNIFSPTENVKLSNSRT